MVGFNYLELFQLNDLVVHLNDLNSIIVNL